MYGLTVKTDFELKGVHEIEKTDDIQVSLLSGEIKKEYVDVTEEECSLEVGYGMICRKDNWMCARFRNLAVFEISNGNKITYQLYEGYDYMHVNELIVCFCMVVLAYQRGMVLIHGSGINYKNRALIISGLSGAGKSSLADELLDRNYLMIADDVVAIDSSNAIAQACASFPMRKLCADAVERKGYDKRDLFKVPDLEREKYAIMIDEQYYAENLDMANMVVIEKGAVEKPELREIKGAEKLKYLVNNLVQKNFYKTIKVTDDYMKKIVKLANQIKLYVLIRPEDKITVKEQADLIEKTL